LYRCEVKTRKEKKFTGRRQGDMNVYSFGEGRGKKEQWFRSAVTLKGEEERVHQWRIS